MADVSSLIRDVRQAWGREFTDTTETAVDIRMAVIAVETVLAAVEAEAHADGETGPIATMLDEESSVSLSLHRGLRYAITTADGRILTLSALEWTGVVELAGKWQEEESW